LWEFFKAYAKALICGLAILALLALGIMEDNGTIKFDRSYIDSHYCPTGYKALLSARGGFGGCVSYNLLNPK
jgi:hypothetical protein